MASLQAKMFVVFALIATMPLMALSYLALTETRDALAAEVGESHADTARAAAAFVGVYTENARVLLGSDATRAVLQDAARARDAEALQLEVDHARERDAYDGLPVFRAIHFLDDSGRVVASSPHGAWPTGTDLSADDRFLVPRARGSAVLLDVPPSDAPALPVAAPVHAEGEFRGVLVGEVALQPLRDRLQGGFAFGADEGLILVDGEGHLLAHPALASRQDWSGVAPVEAALRGGPGYAVFVDPSTGITSLAGYAAVPSLQWAVLDVVPTSVAYAPLTRLTAVLIVLSGILMGGILLGSVVLARRIVKPVRDLTLAAGSLSAGHLGARIEARGDDELAELSRTFNHMADRIVESLDGLRRSEARYRNLVEAANDLILTIEPDGTLSFAGPLAERLLGWPGRELQGRPVSGIVPEPFRARVEQAVRDVVERRRAVLLVVHPLEARDGSTHVFRSNFSPIFGGDGSTVARVLVVSRDITSQQRQERFREASLQMARLVSEETDLDELAAQGLTIVLGVATCRRGAVFILDPAGLRQAAAASSGAAEADVRTADAERRLAQEAVRERRAAAGAAGSTFLALPLLERGEALGAVVVEGEGRAPEGEDAEALATLASQLAVGIRRSLFEGRLKEYAAELEARVEERTRELQAKSHEMEQFLYSVSHDLKAPIISIEGYAQGLEEDYGALLDDDGRMFLERIRKNATLMERLILDILELSRIGRVRETIEEVDLDALFADLASRLDDRFEQAGATLEVQPGLPRVRGEPRRLDQLFTNLLENALKYRHPGRPLKVRVAGEATRDGARLQVVDNGRGLPPGSEQQLFKIFQRLPTPQGMPDPGGTGIGLAIVKRIVDMHGGRVWAGSLEGEGAVFTVELPGWRSVPLEDAPREPGVQETRGA